MSRLFGTDGIRGVANEFLSCDLAMAVGRALGSLLSSDNKYRRTVLIGRDTRISSEMLEAAITAGLYSVGCDVISVGVAPTPAIAYLTGEYGAKAGIVISASHNPFEYNGIKVFGEDGHKLSDELEDRIEDMALNNEPKMRLVSGADIGVSIAAEDALERYINKLKQCTDVSLDGLRIAVDCACGAASRTAERVLSELGADVTMLSNNPNGVNVNAGCGSTDMTALKKAVVDGGFDCGIAFDGDADRCLAVDEHGSEVDGDRIMAILALDLKSRGKLTNNTVVGTVMTNLGFVRFCRENGIDFVAAKVGDRYVSELMDQGGFCLGGEQSGHIILREFATTGDGQLSAIALLSVMKKSGKSLSELGSVMQRFPQHTVNIPATPDNKIAVFTDDGIKAIIAEAEAKLGGDGRILVRPSGTEPLIRIMVEHNNAELCEKTARECAKLLSERLG